MVGKVTNIGNGPVELPNGVLLRMGESAVITASEELNYLLNHPEVPLPEMDKYTREQYQMGLDLLALMEKKKIQLELLLA